MFELAHRLLRRRSARLCLASLGCATLAFALLRSGGAAAADKGPIRIGFLTVKTGALAAGGRQMEEGLALYLDQHQGQLAGRKIEVVTLDTVNTVVQTYPNVSQFWKMSPQEFLESPVYSRSFPEAKNLEK